MQVYDLAWSPTGEFLIAGSTDNTARIFSANDGVFCLGLSWHSCVLANALQASAFVKSPSIVILCKALPGIP